MQSGRKIVYVLGAGASRALAAVTKYKKSRNIAIPIQADFWDVYLKFIPPASQSAIESFLFRYFLGYRRKPGNMTNRTRRDLLSSIDVEEVFTFLSERLGAPSSSPQLRAYCGQLWDELVEGIGKVFGRFGPNASSKRLVKRFHARHIRRNDAIVSFNYDVVFEEALKTAAVPAYVGLENTTKKVRIIKPHGSINWIQNGNTILVGHNISHPVIVAPTHVKFVETNSTTSTKAGYLNQSDVLKEIWAELENEMRSARVLVFIGYSFPPADLYFSSVLRSVLADRATTPQVILVNPDAVAISVRLKQRFALRNIKKYFDFEQYVGAKRQ